MTNKCFAWFLGHQFLDTSGTLIIWINEGVQMLYCSRYQNIQKEWILRHTVTLYFADFSEDDLTVLMCDYNEEEIREIFSGYLFVTQSFDVINENEAPAESEVFDSDWVFLDIKEDSSSTSIDIDRDNTFLCFVCGRKFGSKHNLNVHIYQFHSKSPYSYSCNSCSKSFPHSFLLKKHVRRTHESNFPCDICEKPFKTSYNLKRHRSKLH